MGRSRRSTSRRAERAEHWLGTQEDARGRRWAYEELLLRLGNEAAEELEALAGDLALELAELKRMQNDLYDQVVRVAALEGQLRAYRESAPEGGREPRRFGETERRSLPNVRRTPSLARCEGFEVESADGFVGYVEGLRFESRIDEPDLLEVRGGRFGRELLLIPAEAIDEVVPEEERLVVRGVPAATQDHPRELVNRLRRALHHQT